MAARDLTGERFGRWTVLARAEGTGSAKWICRCSCGTIKAVAGKNLMAGASTSCGCYTKQRVREALAAELEGMRFGKLRVIGRASEQADGALRWKCACDCGGECVATSASLRSGKRTHCGCESLKGRHTAKDVSGKRFSMLTALYPTKERSRNGSVIWHCRCDCGGETDTALDRLRFGSVVSCGCMREKCGRELQEKLTHVAGTSIDAIRSSGLRTDNKTGVKGVFMKRGKFCAMITFQQKNYYLGSYGTLEDAAGVRKEAEHTLHTAALDFYEKWERAARINPTWARENPMHISVVRDSSGEFSVVLQPELAETGM